MEHPSTKEKTPSDMVTSNDDILHKSNSDNLENCLALSPPFQKPAYQIVIPLGVRAGMQSTVESLLDTGAGLDLINSSFLPPKWRSYVKPFKALPLGTAAEQAVPVRGLISLQVCTGDEHARAGLGTVENIALDHLLVASNLDQCIYGIF